MLELNEIRNPFPGIRPFEMDETNLFFGRDGQSDELLQRMQRSRLLAVVGTSGSGKSSLIRAGLLPALYGGLMGDAGSSWRIAILRPGGDPIGNLATALADPLVLGSDNHAEIQAALIETTLRRSSIGLIEVAREARLQEHENLLVVVDQFEELFRFKKLRANDDATGFVKLLLESSAQRDIPIYVIITMRSDFLGDCSQFTGLPEAINNGQYLIPRMSRDERQSAITGPIAVGDGQITPPLVSRLLNDVGDNPDQLPILQHALMRTWEYWAAHRLNGAAIDLDDYTAIGTMAEALSRHADEAFNELPDDRARMIAEKLFKRLTEKGTDNREVRRPTSLAELTAVCEASEGELIAVIDVFRREDRSFLMPPVGTKLTSETVVDIAHESLIRNWVRLQHWVDEEAQSSRTYRRLAEAAVLHREGDEGLMQDPALQVALDWFEQNKPNAAWARRYHPEFDEATKYLTESCEAREAAQRERERQRNAELERERREREQALAYAEQQKRAARRLRWLSVGMAVMFVLALALAAFALAARRSAKASEKAAVQAQQVADALKKEALSQRDEKSAAADRLRLEKEKAEELTQKLQEEQGKTNDALKVAQQAEGRAQSEAATARAKEKDALDAKAAAVAARNLAQGNADRGKFSKDTLESLQRQDYDLARSSAGKLITSVKQTLNDPQHELSKSVVQRLNVERGWAYAHEGIAWLGARKEENAVSSYEKAQGILEKVWPKQTIDPTDPDPILYETYDGLGKTYHLLGLGDSETKTRQETGSTTYFKKAETLFTDSLNYHQARLAQINLQLQAVEARGDVEARRAVEARGDVEARGVVEGHLNLAKLYRDMGETAQAEQQFLAVIGKFPEAHTDELFQVRRQLAEFYRDQNKYGEAVAAYKNLILRQEELAIEDLGYFRSSAEPEMIEQNFARSGQDIANSYNELADAYRGWADATADRAKSEEMSSRADAAFGLSVALERFAVRLRRYLAASGSLGPTDRDDLADNLGDAFLKFDKGARAALFYQYALHVRKTGTPADQLQVGKSYDKLGNLYRSQKDYAKAAQNYQDQVAFYQSNPRSTEYAKAVRDLAALYAEDPDAAPQLAVEKYGDSLNIYHELHDWYGEDVVLYRLTKLYEKRQQAEARLSALQQRVSALAPYYDELVAGTFREVDDGPKLISEYLQAINVLGYVLAQSNEVARAETAYQRAWDMRQYLSSNVKFKKDVNTRQLYDAMLGEYQHFLTAQQKTELAAEVRDFRDKFNRADERNKVVQASAK